MLDWLTAEDAFLKLAMGCVVALVSIALPWLFFGRLERTSAKFRKLHPVFKIFLGVCFSVCVGYGSFKSDSPTNTTGVSFFSMRPAATFTTVSPADFAIRNWNIVGAWDDSFRCEFTNDFVFPCGTNHLNGVEVVSKGLLWEGPFTPEVVASLGLPVELAPGASGFNCEYIPASETNEAKYVFTWRDGYVNRDANNRIDGRIELRRGGDILVATNGVERLIPRVLPFEHSGYGQDDEWVAANFTNSVEILETGYPHWIDNQVGEGLTNGFYKLTVTVPERPLETTELSVGDYSVAVTNAGEYVFLLEKGVEYPLSVFPETATNFVYDAVDDIASAAGSRSLMRYAPATEYCEWSEDKGEAVIIPPPHGLMFFKPVLRVTPKQWNPSSANPAQVFEAVLDDVRPYISRTYRWQSHGADVNIANSESAVTEIALCFPYGEDEMVNLSLEAQIVNHTLEVNYRCPVSRYASCDYEGEWEEGALTNALPDQVSVSVTPGRLIFDLGNIENLKADIVCHYRVHDAGTITLNIENGANCVVKDFDGNVIQDGYTWEVGENIEGVKYFWVKGLDKSSTVTGTVFTVEYQSNSDSDILLDSASVAMYQVNTFVDSNVPPESRRDLGVRERVLMYISPLPADVHVESGVEPGGVKRTASDGNQWVYTAPVCKTNDLVCFSVGDVRHFIAFEIYEPTGYEILQVNGFSLTNEHGVAGCYEMVFCMQLQPTNVYLGAVETVEIGNVATNATGYFLDPSRADWLDHSKGGADNWVSAKEYVLDEAGINCECNLPWGAGGAFSWDIPIYWRIAADPNEIHHLDTVRQAFRIDPEGTLYVSKFGYTGVCGTNRVHYIEKGEVGL